MKLKQLLSCAVTFCLACSLFGVPSIAFAKDALGADDGIQAAALDGAQGSSQSSSSSSSAAAESGQPVAEGAEEGSEGTEAPAAEPIVDSLVAQDNVTEVVDGDVTFFGIEETEALAQAEPVAVKGVQLSGAQVSVKLRSQIHPTSPSGNLTTDFGVKATLLDANGNAISVAQFLPVHGAMSANAETAQAIGDYVATFPDRIPQGNYALAVSGQNYLTHLEQSFPVENGNRISVELVDMVTSSGADTSVSATIGNDKNIQGLLPYGDFNGDGRIDNNDTWMLTRALPQGSTAENLAKYDFNADGAFNLLDAQFFATTIKEGNDTSSSVEELIKVVHGRQVITKDCSQTKVSVGDGVIKIGNTEDYGDAGDGEDMNSAGFEEDALREALFENADKTVILEQGDPISEESPISLAIETAPLQETAGPGDEASEAPTVIEMAGLVIRPPAETLSSKTEGSVSSLADGSVIVEDENGDAFEYVFKDGKQQGKGTPYSLVDTMLRSSSTQAHALGTDGAIEIDFGNRIAIKKITIKVTKTTREGATLAEIGKVEFLNGMEDKIDPPDLSIPTNIQGQPGDKQITFTWDPQLNITGYEIRVTDPTGKVTTSSTVLPTYTIADKKMKSGIYVAAVRSANGEWKSPWSENAQTELVPTKRPDKPTSINVAGGYGELVVSWPAVDDASYYNLYYREESAAQFIQVPEQITTNRYVIAGLKKNTKYILYLTASNKFGTSPKSEDRYGTTLGDISAKVPWYGLINRTVQHKTGAQAGPNFAVWDEETAKANDNIESITCTYKNDDAVNPGYNDYWMIDGDYSTGYIPSRSSTYFDGARVTFDRAFDMNSLVITSSFMAGYGHRGGAGYRVNVKDENGNWSYYSIANGQVSFADVVAKDAKGNNAIVPNTYMVKFPKSSVKEIVVGCMRPYGSKAPIAEIAFYEYDSITDDMNNIWADDMHTVLKEEIDGKKVDKAYLDELEARINTKDPATVETGNPDSGEYIPNRDVLLASMATARSALEYQGGTDPVRVRSVIDGDTQKNVGGINGWQPLGVSARAGDQIQIFVGGRANASAEPFTGTGPTPLVLSISQNGGETKDVSKTITDGNILPGQLKYGINEITVPATNCNIEGHENGGQLYVTAVTSNKNMEFNVRVIGAMDIAYLDLYKVTDDAEYRKRCEAYVDELRTQVENLEATHNERNHSEAYRDRACVANTTDIQLDSMMFSVPASRILDSLGRDASRDEQVEKLITSTKATKDMMRLYWQHKGLGTMTNAEQQAYGSKNGIPAGHLNIRYVRTNPGVLMYAAGNHIGVQWQNSGLAGTPGVTYDANGKWQSGYYFGWGIAHEIGHQINQGAYTYAETTNNYYAQLITVNDTNERSRYQYPGLYDRVTSGVKGAPSGKTGIGIYWQLHLAYDNGYNYKKYNSYTDLYNNLIMARIDSIARNPEKAPGNGFTLAGADKDNALMRLACAAAGDASTGYGRNILDYFVAWGGTPDETTIAYASQFEKDPRPLQYINDDARVYRMEGGESVGANTEVWANLYEGSEVNQDKKIENSKIVNTRQVTIEMGISGDAANKTQGLIGFEVLRNGTPVAFKMFNPTKSGEQDTVGTLTYTDTVVTENNRTYTYEVRAVDNLLAYSKNTVAFPEIKISDKGAYADKTRWSASTNMVSSDDQAFDVSGDDVAVEGSAPSSCEQELEVKAVDAVIDGDASKGYTGTLPTGDKAPTDAEGNAVAVGAPYIEVDFGTKLQVTGITVPTDDAGAIQGATIQMFDGTKWTNAVAGSGVAGTDNTSTYYFNKADDPQLYIYPASKMRIVATGEGATGMTLHELDVLGPVGDNADFLDADGWVGYLDTDTAYAPGEGNTIPAGSLVFVGNYSGDTAYNAMKLHERMAGKDYLVGGTQVLFAEAPGEGRNLGKTADGRWIWYITPAEMAEEGWEMPTDVYIELFRVDDAHTLESERLVANTLTMTLPSSIPTIHLNISNPNNMGEPTVSN